MNNFLSQASSSVTRLQSCCSSLTNSGTNRLRNPSGERQVYQSVKMELYLKAGPQERTVGDCPFAHYVRCVLHFKGLDYKVLPCNADKKPAWLVDEFNGKMPCLKIDDLKLTESGEIAKYLEKTYVEPSLSDPNLEVAMSMQASMFPAMARFVKATEYDQQKEQQLMEELRKLDDHFTANKYLAGNVLSLADYSLAPKLYHLDITVDHFYPATRKTIKEKFKHLENYMSQMFEDSSFDATKYPPEVVVWGWTNARK